MFSQEARGHRRNRHSVTPLSRHADVGGNDGLAALPMRGLKAGRSASWRSAASKQSRRCRHSAAKGHDPRPARSRQMPARIQGL